MTEASTILPNPLNGRDPNIPVSLIGNIPVISTLSGNEEDEVILTIPVPSVLTPPPISASPIRKKKSISPSPISSPSSSSTVSSPSPQEVKTLRLKRINIIKKNPTIVLVPEGEQGQGQGFLPPGLTRKEKEEILENQEAIEGEIEEGEEEGEEEDVEEEGTEEGEGEEEEEVPVLSTIKPLNPNQLRPKTGELSSRAKALAGATPIIALPLGQEVERDLTGIVIPPASGTVIKLGSPLTDDPGDAPLFLSQLLLKEDDEDLDSFLLRREYTKLLTKLPRPLNNLDDKSIVELGYMVMKKARYGITYDAGTEAAIKYVQNKIFPS